MSSDMKKIEVINLECSPERAREIFFETKTILKQVKIRKEASKLLSSSFIQMTPELFSQRIRYKSTTQFEGASYNVIGESITFRDKVINVWTCCFKAKEAINIAASLIIDKINEIDAYINMPHYLIGLPNLRGHCFFVPVLVPLFNNKDFVDALFAGFDIADQEIKERNLVKPETNLAKMINVKDPEGLFESLPFLWTRLIKQLYLQYRKASAYGQLHIINKPNGIEFAYPEIYGPISENDNFDEEDIEQMDCSERPNYKLDIRLDRKLIKLIRELAEFQSGIYRTPGGFSTKLAIDIIENLKKDFMGFSSESPFDNIFFLLFEYEYVCIKCAHYGHLKNRVSIPAITVPSKHVRCKTIQEILDNPEELTKYDDTVCKEYKLGTICNERIILKERFLIKKLPKILTFKVIEEEEKAKDFLKFPEKIYLQLEENGERIYYYKASYSVDFELWKDKKGNLRSEREIAPQENDESGGYHVAAFLYSNQGWVEVNNSNVYSLDKTHSYLKPGSLVFYFIDKEKNFLPNVYKFSEEEEIDEK